MDKKTLRQDLRTRSRSLTPTLQFSLSAQIVSAIASDPLFEQATHIGLYHALPDEPNLKDLLERWCGDKRFYLPRVEGDHIIFHQYQGAGNMISGAFGIQEPDRHLEVIAPQMLQLIYVPALAFDSRGYRLGRGKGYYDRFLPQATSATKVGVTYGLQTIDLLPIDPWDVPMDMVLSASALAQITTQKNKH